MAKKYTWRYRGMKFDSEHAEIHSRGALRIPKAFNRQGVIWDRAKSEEGYDVIFWDWDGTIIRHYTAWNFIEKFFPCYENGQTEWPFQCHPQWTPSRIFYAGTAGKSGLYGNNNPKWDDSEIILEPDGYNWSFREAVEFILRYGVCDIGLMYHTPCTLQWVVVTEPNAAAYFKWCGNYTIDYGDGSEPKKCYNINPYPPSPAQHVYAEQGLYLVKITGTHYGGAQDDEAFIFPGTLTRVAAARRTSIDETTAASPPVSSATSEDQLYAYAYLYKATVHTFALYGGPNCTLNRFALDRTWLASLGFSDSTNLESEKGELFDSISGNFQHVNIPKTWTTLLNSVSTVKHTISGVLGDDDTTYSVYLSPFSRAGDKLKHICFPEKWGGMIYISNAAALERILFGEFSATIGVLDELSGALKLMLMPIWTRSSDTESLHLRKSSAPSADFKLLVPYVINGYYATLNHNYDGWYYGEQWIKNMLQAQTGESWLADYVKAAEYYSYYWQWGD